MVINIGAKPTPPPAKPGIFFNEKDHSYKMNVAPRSSDYLRVVGVTNIIGKTLAKPQLEDYKLRSVARAVRQNLAMVLKWHADLSASRNPEQAQHVFDTKLVELSYGERDRAARRGSAIHEAAEKVGSGQSAKIAKQFSAPVNHYQAWLNDNDVDVILSERPCGNRTLWYAGTFDAIVRFHQGPHAGETWLIDIKTSKSAHGETCLQAAAYANAEFYIDDTNTDRSMPPVDKIGLLHLTNDGAHLYWLGDIGTAMDEFRAILTLQKSVKRRDNLIRKD